MAQNDKETTADAPLPPSLEDLQDELYRAYQGLPPLEMAVTQALSVHYVPMVRSRLRDLLAAAGVRDSRGRQPSTTDLYAILEKLVSRKLVFLKQGEGYACHDLVVELIYRDCRDSEWHQRFETGLRAGVFGASYHTDFVPWDFYRYSEAMQHFRLALYGDRPERVERVLAICRKRFRVEMRLRHPGDIIIGNPFDASCMRRLAPALKDECVRHASLGAQRRLMVASRLCAYLEQQDVGNTSSFLLRMHRLLLGDTRCAAAAAGGEDGAAAVAWTAVDHLVHGRSAQSAEAFVRAVKALRKAGKDSPWFFDGVSGGLYCIAIFLSNDLDQIKRLQKLLVKRDTLSSGMPDEMSAFNLLSRTVYGPGLPPGQAESIYEQYMRATVSPYVHFMLTLCLYWADAAAAGKRAEELRRLMGFSEKCGHVWLAWQCADLVHRLSGDENAARHATRLRPEPSWVPLAGLFEQREPWERVLDSLRRIAPPEPERAADKPAPQTKRLVWHLALETGDPDQPVVVIPEEQKLTKRGGWTTAKRYDPYTRKMVPQPHWLDKDATLMVQYQEYETSYGEYTRWQALGELIRGLAGHPLVFDATVPDQKIDIVLAPAALMIRSSRGGYHLNFEPVPFGQNLPFAFVRESPERLVMVAFTPAQMEMARLLTPSGLSVPENGKQQLVETVSAAAASVIVHSDLDGVDDGAESVEPDARPHLRLSPWGEGVRIDFLVRPIPEGRFFSPGRGSASVAETVAGRRLRTVRSFSDESRRLETLLERCPAVDEALSEDRGAAFVEGLEAAVEAVAQLGDLRDDVVVFWPEKARFQVGRHLTEKDLQVRISREQDWFSLEGRLTIDERQVLDLSTLLSLVELTPGRFIRLDETRILALSEELTRKLHALQAASQSSAGGRRVLHPLSALSLEQTPDEDVDGAWHARVCAIRTALELHPGTPAAFCGEMREYQREGFVWLSRLAAAGAGACLADDMGMGKTVQAMAVLLSRAPGGPALVVAPTSVVMNWFIEARRFAPSLNLTRLGESDRAAAVHSAGPGSVVVSTYGLLYQEAQLLASRRWHTIILDEAQAVKNTATKRSQAAMGLQGDFRLTMTGTPIENNLGELWSMFRFLNPGLLGGIEQFNRRFAAPIEARRDKEASRALRRIITPFVLRRTKAQVLDELPSRTEITIEVEPGAEENAFYEALRRRAIESVADAAGQGGQGRIRILAEIMRLRRACCNPKLVLPDSTIASSKLEAFGESIEELIANNHRALVFSQFVDHLHIIREYLTGHQVSFQYLDGSTPARDRERAVNAFQSGDGTVFLISLKAGGVGLNLTAADYVYHMDPWWNPAVEDQASDRAHRIGQTRPVTIYRFICKGTIEEKIVRLHQEKRDLVNNLLDGADISARLSAEDLLRLIRDA